MARRLLALLCALLVIAPAGPAAAAPPARTWHVVKPGQTLGKIARFYRLRPSDVARWNQIGPPYRVVVDGTLRLTPPPVRLPPWGARAETVTPESIGWDPRRRCPVPEHGRWPDEHS
jgi:hypothetical protein